MIPSRLSKSVSGMIVILGSLCGSLNAGAQTPSYSATPLDLNNILSFEGEKTSVTFSAQGNYAVAPTSYICHYKHEKDDSFSFTYGRHWVEQSEDTWQEGTRDKDGCSKAPPGRGSLDRDRYTLLPEKTEYRLGVTSQPLTLNSPEQNKCIVDKLKIVQKFLNDPDNKLALQFQLKQSRNNDGTLAPIPIQVEFSDRYSVDIPTTLPQMKDENGKPVNPNKLATDDENAAEYGMKIQHNGILIQIVRNSLNDCKGPELAEMNKTIAPQRGQASLIAPVYQQEKDTSGAAANLFK